MDQEVPASVGRASFRATLRAIPVLLLAEVSIRPRDVTGVQACSSPILATSMAAPRTSTEAEAVSDPSLVVVTLAVLSTGEIGRASCRERVERWVVEEAPKARSEGPQLRVPPAMAQVV